MILLDDGRLASELTRRPHAYPWDIFYKGKGWKPLSDIAAQFEQPHNFFYGCPSPDAPVPFRWGEPSGEPFGVIREVTPTDISAMLPNSRVVNAPVPRREERHLYDRSEAAEKQARKEWPKAASVGDDWRERLITISARDIRLFDRLLLPASYPDVLSFQIDDCYLSGVVTWRTDPKYIHTGHPSVVADLTVHVTDKGWAEQIQYKVYGIDFTMVWVYRGAC